jgi:hypothetical protein
MYPMLTTGVVTDLIIQHARQTHGDRILFIVTVDDYQLLYEEFYSEKGEGLVQLRMLCAQLSVLQSVQTNNVFFCMLSGTCLSALQHASLGSRFVHEAIFLPLISFQDTTKMLMDSLSNCGESLASFLKTHEFTRLVGSVGGHMRSLQYLRDSLLNTSSLEFKVRLIF